MLTPGTCTVMVIDDERIDQILCERVLRKAGLGGALVGFMSPTDALTHLRDPDRDKVDVILLDINMPQQSGFEFLEAAMEEHSDELSDAVVLMVTSLKGSEHMRRAAQIQVVDQCLTKPLVPSHIHGIQQMLRSRAGAQQATFYG